MARAQLRKRPRADDLSQDHRPNKKIKPTGELHHRNFPPEFWDGLSKVPLTRRVLRELDRRNSAQTAPGPATPAVYTTDRSRFARHGGPDLRHLRGYPELKGVDRTIASSRSASSSRRTKSTKSTKATTTTPGRSSAYDKAFEQNLNDNNVYLHGRKSKPDNNADLHQTRPSLSPSKFDDGAFEHFQDEHDHLGSEGDVMRKIIPFISGSTNIPNSGDVLFNNLESITDGAAVDVKPDFYDGARFSDIDSTVREDLSSLMIPSDTNAARRPAAPNFFLEAKAPWGGADIAKRQAGLDGAIGARAMHALQNYGDEEPGFDGNAYSYSSTYHTGTGTLQLYTHHVTAPTAPDGRPEYHMTQLDGWQMTGNIDTFRRGATAFRNARDLAQGHRNRFIQAANARARQPRPETPPEAEITVAETQQYEESTCDEFVDCEDDVAPQAIDTENYAASQGFDDGQAPLQHLYADDEQPSQESTSTGADPTMSFATSVTSSFSAESQSRLKRNRASHGPPSNTQPHKKHGSAKART
ncbi:Ribonuclease H-like protein [Coniochaeta hoffmannii]|uniref:Ribonuclease H-like protein n=1 Tax=Coniochaeta hoffmannii TaxID=91930 RepID=A0AA38VZ01_9PEZI|nr:Ribonuclease H-like protein [Coniochaeta hoffmannii]